MPSDKMLFCQFACVECLRTNPLWALGGLREWVVRCHAKRGQSYHIILIVTRFFIIPNRNLTKPTMETLEFIQS